RGTSSSTIALGSADVSRPVTGVESLPQPSSATSGPAGPRFTFVEICAGAGGPALGLEAAGFDPVVLIDSKADACFTIDRNRPDWDIICIDVARFQPRSEERRVGKEWRARRARHQRRMDARSG